MTVGFVPVDELMKQVSIDQVIEFYGIDPSPALDKRRNEIRSRCFLACGRTGETGNRSLAIQSDHPAKQWKCWEKGCGKSGNLISMCDLAKPGENAGGRPRGQRFKEIASDLQTIVESGEKPSRETVPASVPHTIHETRRSVIQVCSECETVNPVEAKFCYDCGGSSLKVVERTIPRESEQNPPPRIATERRRNVPLAESENEKARALVNLDAKFLLPSHIGAMPPSASKYLRQRPWLTDELARKFRMGYLPRDAGDDKSGGTMRGKIVYAFLSEKGEMLTWFGRDTGFEKKSGEGNGKSPAQKFRFVKGFQRGLELFGQEHLHGDEERLQGMGLPIVAGPNDVMRLHALGIPSVALCSEDYQITREQAEKAGELVRKLGVGNVVLLLPTTGNGERGLRQCLGYLCQVTGVRGVTGKMFGGRLTGREVESLTEEEWHEVEGYLRTGNRRGWTLQ